MLSHIDENNNPGMVDISKKDITRRVALAQSKVILSDEILKLLQNGDIISKKGPVFHTAIVAGTMAAKKTGDLIPFCHPVGMESCKINIFINDLNEVVIECEVSVYGKTGIEMEALTGASIAALTVYDMCKAMSQNIIITETKLIKKTGGKSDYQAE